MKTNTYPPIFAYGFRPFFLLAGLFAATSILVWIAYLQGYELLASRSPMHIWHAHEMIYGFVMAAVSGFLLTAIPSWTEQRGFAGAPLLALSLLWLAGRFVFAISSGLPLLLVAMVDLAFVPALALTILPALIRSGNRRNLVFIVLLLLLFMANLHFHIYGAVEVSPLQLAINVMLIMVTVVGTRTIPVFTSSGLRQQGIDIKIPGKPGLDKSALAAVCLILLIDIFYPNSILAATVAAVAAVLLLLQLARWQGHRTFMEPVIWILHIGYAWVPIALMLKAIWLSGAPIPPTSWLHALTTGAFSTMILGVRRGVA